MKRFFWGLCLLCFTSLSLHAVPPDLSEERVQKKLKEIMRAHASHKEMNPELVRRALANYVELLDPSKTYFLHEEVVKWIDPSDDLVEQVLAEYKEGKYTAFSGIHDEMQRAILRRRELEEQIDLANLPRGVKPKEFKDLEYAATVEELKERLEKLIALQMEAAEKLDEANADRAHRRIKKLRTRRENELLNEDTDFRSKLILSYVLKATASSLDAYTSYFTPDEAEDFLIDVQKRLFGIGAQLRDDLNGLTLIKIIEGGPADRGELLKVKDRIIAVNSEPIMGMEIRDAVKLIRGDEGTPVVLTVVRKLEGEEDKEERLDIEVMRGEVVLKETRYTVDYHPYGDGVIAHLRLHSFYEDPEFSSAQDLQREFKEIEKEHKVKGVVLDLRSNTGGVLSQAVAVSGLFISKGIIVSIKDEHGNVQHLRDLDGQKMWDGPLVVLINRASASASEIVAQALQDYGRAIVVGDARSYGKGSFQTFTLNPSREAPINPEGEYKVTRGRYYTVSGSSPQKVGVLSDIVVPGVLSKVEMGEDQLTYPLDTDQIPPNFEDDLSDVPLLHRARVSALYRYDLQPRLDIYSKYLETLQKNSGYRIEQDDLYGEFLTSLEEKEEEEFEVEEETEGIPRYGDLQLKEAYHIIKDLISLENANTK